MASSKSASVTVYGTATCSDCRRSRALLDLEGVEYNYIGIDEDPEAAAWVVSVNRRTSTPYVVFSDGSTQTEPTDEQLRERLIDLDLIVG